MAATSALGERQARRAGLCAERADAAPPACSPKSQCGCDTCPCPKEECGCDICPCPKHSCGCDTCPCPLQITAVAACGCNVCPCPLAAARGVPLALAAVAATANPLVPVAVCGCNVCPCPAAVAPAAVALACGCAVCPCGGVPSVELVAPLEAHIPELSPLPGGVGGCGRDVCDDLKTLSLQQQLSAAIVAKQAVYGHQIGVEVGSRLRARTRGRRDLTSELAPRRPSLTASTV